MCVSVCGNWDELHREGGEADRGERESERESGRKLGDGLEEGWRETGRSQVERERFPHHSYCATSFNSEDYTSGTVQ